MKKKLIIQCENMTEGDFEELYHQIALKISPYGATMWEEKEDGE